MPTQAADPESSAVIDDLVSRFSMVQGFALCYVYFDHQLIQTTQLVDVMRTLLKQLVS
jgi:ABC-type transporter Mla maintaining outer membrane lipid asymmetry ATPase subunit MlaF